MLDKSIPYYHVLMKREKGKSISNFELPSGYKYVLFNAGDSRKIAALTI